MADPLPFSRAEDAAADAELIRRKLRAAAEAARELFGVPSGSVVADPARREKLEHAAEKVAEETAIMAAITQLIPGPAGRVFGKLVAGVEKLEGQSVAPSKATGVNFAPAPFGFLDPTSVGLPKNFYLPAGSTELIPRAADRVGLGIPQQRAEDEIRRARLDAAAAGSRQKTAITAVLGESNETLEDLAAGRGGLTRAGVIRSTSGADSRALEDAARAELARRAADRAADRNRSPFEIVAASVAELATAEREARRLAEGRPGESAPTGQEADLKKLDALNANNPPDP